MATRPPPFDKFTSRYKCAVDQPRCSRQVARLRKARKPITSVIMVVKIDDEVAGSASSRSKQQRDQDAASMLMTMAVAMT